MTVAAGIGLALEALEILQGVYAILKDVWGAVAKAQSEGRDTFTDEEVEQITQHRKAAIARLDGLYARLRAQEA